jgi:hypothetical protein
MAQIFHRSANTIARASIIGVVVVVSVLLWAALELQRSPYATYEGIAQAQPVPFSHQHHVGGDGIDCRYCHTSVENSSFAGIPPTKTCMNCHSQIWTNAPMLEPVRASYRTGKSLEWTRVNYLPDYVYFNHSIHIAKGVGCYSCHGPVDKMPLTYEASSMRMEWCLNCHRAPEKFLRPRDQVFNMEYKQPSEDNKIAVDGTEYTEQIALGDALKHKYNIRTVEDITSCSTCHR